MHSCPWAEAEAPSCPQPLRMAGKQDKRTLYVGGLDEDVNVEVLRAAFIPFGEVGVEP